MAMSRNVEMTRKFHVEEAKSEIEILSRACLPHPSSKRRTTRVLRPERPECAAYLNIPPSPQWTKALLHIQNGIHRKGEDVERFCRNICGPFSSSNERRALRAVAAVLYDQECSGLAIPAATEPAPLDLKCPVSIYFPISFGAPSFYERMLLVDYGLDQGPGSGKKPEAGSWVYRRFYQRRMDNFCRYLAEFVHSCKLGHFPKKEAWFRLGEILRLLCYMFGNDVADVAIQLYYYHTHQRQLTPMEYKAGVMGYTGIIQELEDEVPRRGPARLMRKLSADVNYFIPYFIDSLERQKTLVAIVESIAARYDLCIVYSEDGKNRSMETDKVQANLPSYSPPTFLPGYKSQATQTSIQ